MYSRSSDRAVEVIRLLIRRDDGKVAQLQHDVPEVTQALAQIRNGEQLTVTAQAAAPIAPVIQVATAVLDRPEESAGPEVESSSTSSPLTDEYLLPVLDAEVLSYFAPEAQEYLESLEGSATSSREGTAQLGSDQSTLSGRLIRSRGLPIPLDSSRSAI